MKNKGNISQELLETIERYLNDEMKSDERLTFEEKLEKDNTLRQNVEDVKIVLLGIETSVLKEKLNTFHEDLPESKRVDKNDSKVRSLSFSKYAIAASVAVLIALGGWWTLSSESSHKKIFAKHFRPDPGLATTMSSNTNYEFYDAMVNYKQGDYKTAIGKWKKLVAEKPQNDSINYFLGVAHLADGSENKAIPYLTFVTETKKSAFKKEAFYYLGLVHLKKGNRAEAKINLNRSEIDKSKLIITELED